MNEQIKLNRKYQKALDQENKAKANYGKSGALRAKLIIEITKNSWDNCATLGFQKKTSFGIYSFYSKLQLFPEILAQETSAFLKFCIGPTYPLYSWLFNAPK